MGIMREVRSAWREAAAQQSTRQPNIRRDLTEEDRTGWQEAMDSREQSIKPRTIQDVQALLRHRNPIRWNQLRRDFRWMQKEMKRMGLNPEDARYIL